MDTGFFTMADVQDVLACGSVEEAREQLKVKIETFKQLHPTVYLENVAKATAAIDSAKSKNQLAFVITNFVLAHPSEGLKVIN